MIMDYRFREYYLVHFNVKNRDDVLVWLKAATPSLKMHKPYNHMAYENASEIEYDGKWWRLTKLSHVDMMLSCRKEEANILENEMNRLNNANEYGLSLKRCKFYRLTKGFCGQ